MSGAGKKPRVVHLLGAPAGPRAEVLEASDASIESKRARLILRIRSYFGCDEEEANRQVQRFAALFRSREEHSAGTGDVVLEARGVDPGRGDGA